MLRISRLLSALLLFACMGTAAVAQSTTEGAIGGVIRDPQGAVIVGATVTAVNNGTNKQSTATTSSEGSYRIAQLQPGTYTVTITATGFAPAKQENVIVEVGRITPVEAQLGIAGVTGESVTVTSEAPVINTEQQDFSTNINQTSINELPTNGRRAANFVILTPATVPDGSFGLISVRGISGLLNNSTVDGGDNNQAFFSEERGRTRIQYVVSQAAIREFQVNTSNYSAEYGRAAGGVINTVTKSGTNELHGSGFYYTRNSGNGARNPLATQSILNPDGTTTLIGIRPKDLRQQFGGTIGGRIIKDKLFFFFSYDGQRRNFPGVAIFSSPTYLNISAATRSALNARGISDTQITATQNFLLGLTGTVPRRGDQNIYFPKLDWQINQNNRFSISYNRLRWNSPAGIQTQPTNTRGIASFGDDFVKVDSVNLRLTSTISPTVLNEARYQNGRDFEYEFTQPPAPGEPRTGPNGSAPDVFLTNGLEFGKPTFLERRAFPDERRNQFADTVTLTRGKQTFKFGGDFNHVRDVSDNLRNESGAYSYGTLADFIVDYVNYRFGPVVTTNTTCVSVSNSTRGKCYSSAYNQGFGPTRFAFSTNEINLFVQDDIKVTPKLTVNLGLRWEYERLPTPFLPNPDNTTIVPNTNNLTLNQLTSTFPNNKNNFGPRIGFAYDISGNAKTVVRGGYGVYYGRIINSTILNALTNTGNLGGQFQLSAPNSSASAPIFPNVLTAPSSLASIVCTTTTAVGCVFPSVQFFQPNLHNPLIHEGDAIIERQIAQNTVISASYLVSFGRRLPRFIDLNLPPPVSGYSTTYTIQGGPFDGQSFSVPFYPRKGQQTNASLPTFCASGRPLCNYGALTQISDTVRSTYNALVLQANRRFTNGLQFQASYTLAKSTDNGQTSATFTNTNDPLDPNNINSEMGRSNFDIRHKFIASAVYSPAFLKNSDSFGRYIVNGFTISPIFSLYSGYPVNPVVSGTAPSQTINGVSTPPVASGLLGAGGGTRLPLVARNAFQGPKRVNLDLRLSRRFRIKERAKLELLAEGFNVFNRTQVTGVNNTIYVKGPNSNIPGCGSVSSTTLCYNTNTAGVPLFLKPTEAGTNFQFRERQIQFAARFEF